MNRMKRWLCCLLVVCAMPLVISADSGYSTKDDPLITLSYLEQVYKEQVKEEVLAEISIDDLTAEMKAQLKSELSAELQQSLKAELETSLYNSLKQTLTAELTQSLKEQLKQEMAAQIEEEVASRVSETMVREIIEDLTEKLEEELAATLEEKLKNDLTASLSKDLAQSISKEITETLTEELREEMEDRFNEAFRDGIPEGLGQGVYELIALEKGDIVMADGPVELIMTSGLAKAVILDEDAQTRLQGIYDLAQNKRILDGQEILQRHYIVISENARGLFVTSAEAYIMIRGEYSIVEQGE